MKFDEPGIVGQVIQSSIAVVFYRCSALDWCIVPVANRTAAEKGDFANRNPGSSEQHCATRMATGAGGKKWDQTGGGDYPAYCRFFSHHGLCCFDEARKKLPRLQASSVVLYYMHIHKLHTRQCFRNKRAIAAGNA